MPLKNQFTNKCSNFIASVSCYVIMPLTPFVFEYFYSLPHEITKRSVMIIVSAYSFSLAFGTKFRAISIALILNGFLTGGMYGTVKEGEIATLFSFPSVILFPEQNEFHLRS
jgi:hypothetical protein